MSQTLEVCGSEWIVVTTLSCSCGYVTRDGEMSEVEQLVEIGESSDL